MRPGVSLPHRTSYTTVTRPDWTGLQGRASSPTRGYLGPAPDPSSPRCSRSIEATSAAATAPSAQGPGIAPQAAPQSPLPAGIPQRGQARAYPPRRLPGDSARGPAPMSAGAERGTRPCTGAAPRRRGCTQAPSCSLGLSCSRTRRGSSFTPRQTFSSITLPAYSL